MGRSLKRFLARVASLALIMHPPLAYALPAGGQVVGGSATISTGGSTISISQSSQKAIIDWNSFNIGSNETVQFLQPNASAIALNKINDPNASVINGNLLANGNVWLLNTNGVLFGRNAQVNVGGLLATTSAISNSDFMAGNYHFTPGGNPNAGITNEGSITVAEGGLADFVAPSVVNSGIITAMLGKVSLASGDSFTLDMYGDNLINLQVSNSVASQLVANHGTISANGGIVALTAAAANSVVNSLINMDGVIQADSIGTQNGQVVLYAAGSNAVAGNVAANKGTATGASTVLVSGTISASGYGSGQTGGTVQVLGDDVGILTGAKIDVSGDAGGGTIRVGGDFHGQGTTPTALSTVVQSGTQLLANAVTSGNGGNVAVWSDNWTDFEGSIQAKGGASTGNGGFVETSGGVLNAAGNVNASAPNGFAGTWLLDPNNVTISTGTDNTESGNPSFVANGTGSVINTGDIVADLNGGTNVTVTASGSITLANPIAENTYSGLPESLTLNAGTDITLNSTITASGPTQLNVTLDADTAAGGGVVKINSGGGITTNGGSIIIGGGANAALDPAVGDAGNPTGVLLNGAILNAGGGNIIINGTGQAATSSAIGVGVENASTVSTTGSGTITINGTGGSGSTSDYGFYMNGTNTTEISAGNGAINITGNAGGSGGTNYGIYILENSGTADPLITTSGSGGTITLTGAPAGTTVQGIYAKGTTQSDFIEAGDAVVLDSGQDTVLFDANINYTGSNTPSVKIDSDYTAAIPTVGTISLSNSNISTNGGSITLGGGTNPLATGAVGDSSNIFGVTISATTLNAGSGNISVIGTGYSGGGGNYGVELTASSVAETTGTGSISITGNGGAGSGTTNFGIYVPSGTISTTGGSISLNGTGGAGTSSNYGVDIATSASLISTQSGAISIIGQGGNGTAGTNDGVYISTGATIQSTGNAASNPGTVTISGTGGGGTGNNYGFVMSGGGTVSTNAATMNITGTGGTGSSSVDTGVVLDVNSGAVNNQIVGTGVGNITVNGIQGTYSGSFGITTGNTGGAGTGLDIFGGTGMTGNFTLEANKFSILTANTKFISDGTLTLEPYTTATIGVNGGTGTINATTGFLSLIDTSTVSPNLVVIGNSSTAEGVVTIGNNWNISGYTFPISVYGTTVGYQNITMGGYNLTLDNLAGNMVDTGITVTKSSGSNATLTLETSGDLEFESSNITSTSNALNVIIGADSGLGASGGSIFMSGSTITTNGGNVFMGGGANPQTTSTVGSSGIGDGISISTTDITTGAGSISLIGTGYSGASYQNGIGFADVTLATTTGNITLKGTGGSGGPSNYGIQLNSNTTGNFISSAGGAISLTGVGGASGSANDGIETEEAAQITGTGNTSIYMNGTGGNGSDSDSGIVINGSETITTQNGAITLIGQGGNNSGNYNLGINVGDYNVPHISTTGTGTITISGTGGIGSGSGNEGVDFQGGIVTTSGSGNIVVTGQGGLNGSDSGNGITVQNGSVIGTTGTGNVTLTGIDGAGPYGYGIDTFVYSGGNNALGSTGMTGNLTFIADSISFTNLGITTAGVITLEPYTNSTSIGLNGGAGTLAVTNAGFFSLINTGTVAPSLVNIGNAVSGTGLATIANNWNISGYAFPIAVYGGTISNGNIAMGGYNLTLDSLAGNMTEAAGTTITKSSGGAATLDLMASGSLIFNGTSGSPVNISSTSNALNVILDADTTQSASGGAIYMAGKNNITSNGGNITLGGGANPLTTSAVGTSTYNDGILLGTLNSTTGSTLNAGGGNITLNGTGYANSSGNNLYGVALMGGSLLETTSGNISVYGTGGAGTFNDYGIYLVNTASDITTQTGEIYVQGQGGNSSAAGNVGVYINSDSVISSSSASTSSGEIDIQGTAGSGTSGNDGILNNGTISTVAGQLVLNGTGAGTGSTNYGTFLTYNTYQNGEITTQSGAISITGTGSSSATASNSNGVVVDSNTTLSSTGSGTISINGTGGAGTGADAGVVVLGTTTTDNGAMSITGQGGAGSGMYDFGVQVHNGGVVSSTGTGTITITGTAGAGTGTNDNGVLFQATAGENATVTSQTGNISITGTGANSSSNGIAFYTGGQVLSTGSANISLTGNNTGGGGHAIYMDSAAPENSIGSSSMTGNITFTADTFNFSSSANDEITTAGEVIFKPYTNSTSIGINGGAGTLSFGNSGFFSIINTSVVSPSLVVIGNSTAGTGQVTIGNGWNISGYTFPISVYGGSVNAQGITLGGYNLTLDALAGDINFAAGSDISKSTGASSTLDLLASGSIFFNGTSGGTDSITSTSNTLNIVMDSDTGVGINGGAITLTDTNITSNGGNITFGGGSTPLTTGAVGTAANNDGIDITGGNINAGSGNIVMNGTGYGSASGANGIELTDAQVGTSSGNITMGGVGGAGGSNDNGIALDSNTGTTTVSTTGGAIFLTGTGGGGTGQVNQGIVLNGSAQVNATGNGSISLAGTGGGTYVGMGVALNSAGAVVSTQNGAIDITGQGGNDASGYGVGVYIGNNDAAHITSTGTGTITISGTAGPTSGTAHNDGVDIWGGIITADNGNVSITGQGATNSTGTGVFMQSGSSITSTGTATISLAGTGGGSGGSDGILLDGSQISSTGSNITLNGTGGAVGSQNNGINFDASTNTISSNGGAISLTGVGGSDAAGQVNQGIVFNAGTDQIAGTGNSTVSLTGTGGGNYVGIGIAINNSADSISAQNGNITLTGTGGSGTSGYNIGVLAGDNSAATITSTGSGTITISGTSGSGIGGGNNNGVDIWSGVVTSASGNIAITGHGGVNSGDTGIDMASGGNIASTGSANITMTGIAGGVGLYGITGSGGTAETVGGSSMTGNLTLIADTINLNNFSMSSKGVITLDPHTASTSIGINGGAGTLGDANSGFLAFINTGTVSPSEVVIGNSTSGTGAVTIGNGWDVSGYAFPIFVYGGTISGQGISLGGYNLTLDALAGDMNFAAGSAISKASGGNSTLDLLASGSILFNGTSGSTESIASTSNKLNVVMDSDTGNGVNGGVIALNYTNITSNGGNVTLGGGANPAVDSAVGTAANVAGIALTGGTISSGTGNILLNGMGGNNPGSTNDNGITLFSGAQVSTTSGNITFNGNAGNGLANSDGIDIDGSTVASSAGTISLTGLADATGAGNDNIGILIQDVGQVNATGNATIVLNGTGGGTGGNEYGIAITSSGAVSGQNGNVTITGQAGSSVDAFNDGIVIGQGTGDHAYVTMTGTGTLAINGTGGSGIGHNEYGIVVDAGTITTATGNVNITGQGGVNGTASDFGIAFADSGSVTSTGSGNIKLTAIAGGGSSPGFWADDSTNIALGGNSMTGNLTLVTDGLSDDAQLSFATSGVLTLKPYTNSTSIGINGGTGTLGDAKSDFLALINTATVSPSSVVIGNSTAGTGLVTIGNGWDVSGYTFPIFVYGGSVSGQGITLGGSNLTLDALAGDMNFAAGSNISKSIGGNSTLDLMASGSILFNGTLGSTDSISSTSNILNVVVDSDTGLGAGGGAISFENTDITSNGGNITLGGGSNPLTTAAVGTAANAPGVLLDGGSILSAGAGNISLRGTGYSTSGGSFLYGVELVNGSQAATTSGNITITGMAGTGGDYNDGVALSTNSLVTSQSGAVAITGQGGTSTGLDNYGIQFYNGAEVTSTGTATLSLAGIGASGTSYNVGIEIGGSSSIIGDNGTVSVTGTGGAGSSVGNDGIQFYSGGNINSVGSGNITITGIEGSNSTSGITSSTGTNTLGGNSMTGNLTLVADGINLSNLSIADSGVITLKPYTNSATIGINGGAGTLAVTNSGFLSLINTGTVSPGSVVIGNASSGTGAVTIGSGWSTAGYNFPIDVYGGSITTGSITGGSSSLLLDALAGNITINSGAALTSTSTGTGLTLVAAQNFINNSDASALSDTNGQWLVYSTNPADNTLNGLTSDFERYSCVYGGSCPSFPATGNGLMYSVAGTNSGGGNGGGTGGNNNGNSGNGNSGSGQTQPQTQVTVADIPVTVQAVAAGAAAPITTSNQSSISGLFGVYGNSSPIDAQQHGHTVPVECTNEDGTSCYH